MTLNSLLLHILLQRYMTQLTGFLKSVTALQDTVKWGISLRILTVKTKPRYPLCDDSLYAGEACLYLFVLTVKMPRSGLGLQPACLCRCLAHAHPLALRLARATLLSSRPRFSRA
jgi:hypothetical protein